MSSFVEKLRRMSTGNKTDDSQAASPRNNVWSSTFDPGRNANMKKMGSSYYDKPAAGDSATVWDQHLEAQKQAAPQSPTSANNQVGQKTIDKEDLQKMMTPSNVEAAMQKVDPSGTGKIDFDQFMSQLRSVASRIMRCSKQSKVLRFAFQRQALLTGCACVLAMLLYLKGSVLVTAAHGLSRKGINDDVCDQKWDSVVGLNLTSTLEGLGLLSKHENCFAKMLWNGTAFVHTGDEFAIICSENKAAMSVRLAILRGFVSHVFVGMKQPRLGFIVDVTDATRDHRDLFERLKGISIVGIGKGAGSEGIFLLPDPYMIAGVAFNEMVTGVIPRDLHGFGKYLSPSYNSKTLSAVPWMDRQSKLLYRGSCHPTINASETQGHYLLRGEFCKTLQNQESSGIDFKLRSSKTQTCSQHAQETLLVGNCLPCCSNSSLKVNYMAQNFKYQLILDGYGPSYESGIWKFLSCGTVFKGEHPSGQKLELFWNQFVEEGVDFISVFPNTMVQKFKNCLQNEQRCQAIAQRGCSKMHRIVSWDFMIQYTCDIGRQLNDVWHSC